MKINKRNTLIFIAIITMIIAISFFLQDRYRRKPIPINVMIIVIDSLRPDHLGCYGYERNTSPNIDGLAKEGVRFNQSIAAGGWTFESVPSILTGTYPFTHQIRNFGNLRNPQIKTLAQELATRNYWCVLWSNLITLKHLDIKNGFQRLYVRDINRMSWPFYLSDYSLTSQAIDRLRRQYKDFPFFFYIHYRGCHVPYRLPVYYKYMYMHDKHRKKPEFVPISNLSGKDTKYDAMGKIPYALEENNITDPHYYISQYDGAISYTDAQVGRLIDSLKKLGIEKKTLIILTADHGEMLGEHNIYFNHYGSFEENIKVPLIIKLPTVFPKGRVISRQINLVDIAPTILEVIGLKKPYYMQGESLLAFFKPYRTYLAQYAFSSYMQKFSLRTEDWKTIYNGETNLWTLYDLKNDPKEQHNLAAERLDKLKQLKQELADLREYAAFLTPAKEGPALTEEDREALRSLGYAQ